jgi:GntR family transcriptional regulator
MTTPTADLSNNQPARERSAYRVLADQLRELAKEPEVLQGKRLPTETELAERYKVGRQTVRRAMQDLVTEGLVYRVAGRGTFAIPRNERYLRYFGSVEDLLALSLDTEFQLHTPLKQRVDIESAGRLGLQVDTISALGFSRLHEGRPICYTVVRLPVDVARLIEGVQELTRPGSRSTITILGLLDERLGDKIIDADQSISATTMPAIPAAALGCTEGETALRVDRLYSTQTRHVELATSWFRGDLYSYRIRLRRS